LVPCAANGNRLSERTGWSQNAETSKFRALFTKPAQREIHPFDIGRKIAGNLRRPQEGDFRAVVSRDRRIFFRISRDQYFREDFAFPGRGDRISHHGMIAKDAHIFVLDTL
jgi:hypothetical protein